MNRLKKHSYVIRKKKGQCNFSDKMVKMSLSFIFLAIILSLVKGNPSHGLKHDKPTVSKNYFKILPITFCQRDLKNSKIMLKFIYSEKAIKINIPNCFVLQSNVKPNREIISNCVPFSEYMKFTIYPILFQIFYS